MISEETRNKMRQAKLDNPTRYWKGKKRSEDTIKKMSEGMKGKLSGEKNPSWGGGKNIDCPVCGTTFWLQPAREKLGVKCCSKKCSNINRSLPDKEFSEKRRFGLAWWRKLRAEIINIDGVCQSCGTDKGLCVHHIIPYRDTKDNSPENLIVLCKKCHIQEDWRIICQL